jgi:V8-like Glu-specific endopeptidase
MAAGRHSRVSRPAGRPFGRASWRTGLAVATACAFLLMTPTAEAAVGLAARLAAASTLAAGDPAAGILAGAHAFAGTPAVGALFTVTGGGLGRHFCTASVVDSPAGDLLITAAHCVTGRAPGTIAFVPGYHTGHEPYGIWPVKQVIADNDWLSSGNPDHDVAFLVVHQPGSGQQIQNLTSGEELGTGWRARVRVHVLGYPDATQQPVTCANETRRFRAHEMEFDCGGYTDGTSGGPFLARLGSAGTGTVIGVIGGYERGGYLPAVSYSPRFGRAVENLYRTAISIADSTGG